MNGSEATCLYSVSFLSSSITLSTQGFSSGLKYLSAQLNSSSSVGKGDDRLNRNGRGFACLG